MNLDIFLQYHELLGYISAVFINILESCSWSNFVSLGSFDRYAV